MNAQTHYGTAEVRMFPRRKGNDAGSQPKPEKNRLPAEFSFATIAKHFKLPQTQAAHLMGVSITSIKLICRRLGIERWPYRRGNKRRKASSLSSQSSFRAVSPEAAILVGSPDSAWSADTDSTAETIEMLSRQTSETVLLGQVQHAEQLYLGLGLDDYEGHDLSWLVPDFPLMEGCSASDLKSFLIRSFGPL